MYIYNLRIKMCILTAQNSNPHYKLRNKGSDKNFNVTRWERTSRTESLMIEEIEKKNSFPIFPLHPSQIINGQPLRTLLVSYQMKAWLVPAQPIPFWYDNEIYGDGYLSYLFGLYCAFCLSSSRQYIFAFFGLPFLYSVATHPQCKGPVHILGKNCPRPNPYMVHMGYYPDPHMYKHAQTIWIHATIWPPGGAFGAILPVLSYWRVTYGYLHLCSGSITPFVLKYYLNI